MTTPRRVIPKFPLTRMVAPNNAESIRRAINEDILPTLALLRSTVNYIPTEVDADYEVVPADQFVLVHAASGVGITLPLVRFCVRPVWIKNKESSAAAVTVQSTDSELIGAATSYGPLAAGDAVLLLPGNDQWWTLP